MKTSLSAALLIAAMIGLTLRAESTATSSADATSASAAVPVSPEIESAAAPTTFDHVVYLARLPAPAALLQGAKTQGATITRMDQTSDRLVVVYEYSGGRTVTFAYTLLSAAANYPAPALRANRTETVPVSTAVYTETTPATRVVYTEPETIYYTPRYRRYYEPAWDFWTPLALGVGIGLIGSHDHGWHGGGGLWHGGRAGHSGRGGHGGRHRACGWRGWDRGSR